MVIFFLRLGIFSLSTSRLVFLVVLLNFVLVSSTTSTPASSLVPPTSTVSNPAAAVGKRRRSRHSYPSWSPLALLSRGGNNSIMSAAPASPADADVRPPVLPRRLTLSGGGVPEINAAVSSDETEILESRALAAQAIRGGGEVKAAVDGSAAAMRLHKQHMISSLAAGVGSGFLASVVCAPLDLIRTRMQVMGDVRAHGAPGGRVGNLPSLSVYRALSDIVKADGIKGCFRGLGATLATVPAFWGLYFPLYEHLKKDLHHRYDRMKGLDGATGAGMGPCPPLVHMGAAITAGAAADICCNPMFLVRTRMQTEALHYFERPPSERVPHGLVKTIQTVYSEGGIPAFWRGLTASLLGLGHVAIQFPVYEFLKKEARANSETGEESPVDLLLASGVSKMCASLLTYPHEVIRSRMMDARGVDAGQGAIRTIGRIIKNEGWGGMYTGIHVSLLRVVPNCCITFMSYELILRWAKENVCR